VFSDQKYVPVEFTFFSGIKKRIGGIYNRPIKHLSTLCNKIYISRNM
jgi:hypothetical protein